MAKLLKVDLTQFKEYINNDKFVLVYFCASWCAPCRSMNDIIEQLEEQMNGKIKVLSVDVDSIKELFVIYEVSCIPTVVLFYEGKAVERVIGYQTVETVVDWAKSTVRQLISQEKEKENVE